MPTATATELRITTLVIPPKYVEPILRDPENIPAMFDSSAWIHLCEIGLKSTTARLVHAATLHYQHRSCWANEDKLRTVRLCLKPMRVANERLTLRDVIDPDEKQDCGELLGTAVAIEFFCAASPRIQPANFLKLHQGRTPVADYSVRVAGYPQMTVEAKGQQGVSSRTVQNACNRQLRSSPPPKFALGVRTTYDSKTPVRLYLSDPDVESPVTSEFDELLCRIRHYADVVSWAGYVQMATLLHERADAIEAQGPAGAWRFDGQSLREELLMKAGRGYQVQYMVPGMRIKAQSFIPHRRRTVWQKVFNDTSAAFLVDMGLFEVLIEQRFGAILNYRFTDATIVEEFGWGNAREVSVREDGSVFMLRRTLNPAPARDCYRSE